jgi:hypothetical protein
MMTAGPLRFIVALASMASGVVSARERRTVEEDGPFHAEKLARERTRSVSLAFLQERAACQTLSLFLKNGV